MEKRKDIKTKKRIKKRKLQEGKVERQEQNGERAGSKEEDEKENR